MMKKDHPILYKEIKYLSTSDEFLKMANLNNFQTLQDVLQASFNELMKRPLFDYRMLSELGSMLESYGIGELMDED